MDFSKNFYQNLGARERAIACYSAINRNDDSEINRLAGHVSKDRDFRMALLGLGQAMDYYNFMMAKTKIDLLLKVAELRQAIAFCDGWLSAGGSIENEKYQKNFVFFESASEVYQNILVDLHEVEHAAQEWCQKNKIPVDFFSGPLCLFPLSKEIREMNDSETLDLIRSVFKKILLA